MVKIFNKFSQTNKKTPKTTKKQSEAHVKIKSRLEELAKFNQTNTNAYTFDFEELIKQDAKTNELKKYKLLKLLSFNYQEKDKLIEHLLNVDGVVFNFDQLDLYTILDFYRVIQEQKRFQSKLTNIDTPSELNLKTLENIIGIRYDWVLFEINNYQINSEFERNLKKYRDEFIALLSQQLNEETGLVVEYLPNRLAWKYRLGMLGILITSISGGLIYNLSQLNSTPLPSYYNYIDQKEWFPIVNFETKQLDSHVVSLSPVFLGENDQKINKYTIDKTKLKLFLKNTYIVDKHNPYKVNDVLIERTLTMFDLVRGDNLEGTSIIGYPDETIEDFVAKLNFIPFKNFNLNDASFTLDIQFSWNLNKTDNVLELKDSNNTVWLALPISFRAR